MMKVGKWDESLMKLVRGVGLAAMIAAGIISQCTPMPAPTASPADITSFLKDLYEQ